MEKVFKKNYLVLARTKQSTWQDRHKLQVYLLDEEVAPQEDR
jgi:hypothetical protein